jgi:hypothetical protein
MKTDELQLPTGVTVAQPAVTYSILSFETKNSLHRALIRAAEF